MPDKIDLKILDLLQRDAGLSAADIGERVGLSPSPCARRIRQLEQQGYIKGLQAQLDAEKLGFQMTVFVQVRLSQHQEKPVAAFEAEVQAMADVVSCFTVSGAFDYRLQVVIRDLKQYEQWVRRLQRLPMVDHIDSSFAIRTVKDRGPLPLG